MTSARRSILLWGVLATLTCGPLAGSGEGQTVTEIRHTGDPANRIDLVILGDGYTAADVGSGKFALDVETFTQGLFLGEPYNEYQRYYNVSRVNIVSNEAGADHPHLGIFKDTAFDAS